MAQVDMRMDVTLSVHGVQDEAQLRDGDVRVVVDLEHKGRRVVHDVRRRYSSQRKYFVSGPLTRLRLRSVRIHIMSCSSRGSSTLRPFSSRIKRTSTTPRRTSG